MQTNETGKVKGTEFSAVGTSLASQIRTNLDYSDSFLQSLIFDEGLQLVETPTVNPSIKPFSHILVPALPYSFKVFHYDCVNIAVDDLFAYVVVDPSHIAFLSARNSFQKSFSIFCAFTMESSPQILELNNLGLMTFEYSAITTDSEIVYSEVNSEFLVATRTRNVNLSRECDMKEHPSFSVFDEFKSLVSPVKILPITFGNTYKKISPFTFNKSSKANLVRRECEQVSIKADRTRLYNWLLFKLSRFEVFRCFSNSLTREISRKPVSQILVNKMMKLKPIAYLGFKSLVNSVLNCLKKNIAHIKQIFTVGCFDFYRGNELHNQTILLKYLSLSEVKASIPHPQ